MARIRSIKPEVWNDQKLARLSRDARLLYIALWNFADEQARMVGDPRQVKGMCFALDDDLTPADVDRLLDELAALGRVVRYTVDGERYLYLPKLGDHQRLDARQPSRYPAPTPDAVDNLPVDNPGPVDNPENPASPAPTDFPGEVRGESAEVHPRARAYVAGSREQVAGSRNTPPTPPQDAADSSQPPTPAARARPSTSDVHAVFDAWKHATGKTGRTILSPKRRKAIVDALRDYPLDEVLDAVRGWQHDPWPERPNYVDLPQLLRHVEKFRDLARDGPPAARSNGHRTSFDYIRQQIAIEEAREQRALELEGGAEP